jgi:hypothetical protein
MKHITIILLLFLSCSNKEQLPEPMGYINKTHSKPTSKGVIFLDFDGGKVNSSQWPVDSVSISGLLPSVQQRVLDTVLADFGEFELDITTNEDYFKSSPLMYKMRVIITRDYEWTTGNAGGLAHLNSIKPDKYAPCFVFTPDVSYNPRLIAKTISHEVGHTFGLSHQSSPYAIMCSGNPNATRQWIKGYNIFDEFQDDAGVIKSLLAQQ